MTLSVIILPKATEDILDHMAYLDDHGAKGKTAAGFR